MCAAMSNESRMDDDRLRDALEPGQDCLSIEDLGLYLDQKGDRSWRATVQSHVAACPHCATEMHLMQEFQSADVPAQDAEAVRAVTAQLERRSSEIFGHRRETARAGRSWWREL